MIVSENRRIFMSDEERASLVWRKARSSSGNGQCVEVASDIEKVAIRDSKHPDGPILVCTHTEFSAFLRRVTVVGPGSGSVQ